MDSVSSTLRRKLLSVREKRHNKEPKMSTNKSTVPSNKQEEIDLEKEERPDFVKDQLISYLQACQDDNLWLLRQTLIAIDDVTDYSHMDLSDLTLSLNELLTNEHQ